MTPRTGQPAPAALDLHDHRGKWVAVVFFPDALASVSPAELRAFAAARREFEASGVTIVAVGPGARGHRAWAESEPELAAAGIPVIADTARSVASAYGVLGRYGTAQRATFVIDPEGVVRYATVADHTFGRSPDDLLRVIGALQTEEEYRVGWPAAPALSVAA